MQRAWGACFFSKKMGGNVFFFHLPTVKTEENVFVQIQLEESFYGILFKEIYGCMYICICIVYVCMLSLYRVQKKAVHSIFIFLLDLKLLQR